MRKTLAEARKGSEAELLAKVDELNDDPNIDGFIVQVPLPKHINEDKVTEAISARKDVDGFHPENLGRMLLGLPTYISATPNGIMELLKRNNIETAGKHCVVVGRSNIVGTPMAVASLACASWRRSSTRSGRVVKWSIESRIAPGRSSSYRPSGARSTTT